MGLVGISQGWGFGLWGDFDLEARRTGAALSSDTSQIFEAATYAYCPGQTRL